MLKCLVLDPLKRPTVVDILKHPLFNVIPQPIPPIPRPITHDLKWDLNFK